MKNTLKIVAILLAVVFLGGGLQAQNKGNHLPKPRKGVSEQSINTRIDNMTYWRHQIEKGLVEVAPERDIPPATYTGSAINARTVIIEDSPDVVVTEENSTQSENSIFVSPVDNMEVINSNNSTQNPVGSLYGANDFYSFDGGDSWGGEVQGAGGSNSGDPAVVISNDGTWYVGYIHSNYGQGVSYSTNQGQSWTAVQVHTGYNGGILDKNHLWIDNSNSSPYEGYLYDGWVDLGSGSPAYAQIEIARSTDAGQSWDEPVSISEAINAGSHNQGVNIQTGPDGEVYAVWAVYDGWPTDESTLGFARSFDGGASWQPASRIIENIRGIRTSETSKNMRVNSFPTMTVDISNSSDRGSIYVTWTNIGTPGINTGSDIDVYMIKSTDQGATWSDPIRVNQDEAGQGKEHYFPWITCDPDYGTLSVVFYDDRNVSSNQCEVFVANSTDGGQTWEDFKVSDVSFTPQPIAGLAGGYFGDYLGISARNRKVYPVWTDNRLGEAMTFVSPFETGPPPNTPWIIYDDHIVNDAMGNNNGMMDFNESIALDLTLANIGDLPSTGVQVTLSTEMTDYITITDAEADFGDFTVEQVKTVENAFALDVAAEIPDGMNVVFGLNITDANDSTWTSEFSIEAHAPALELGGISILDPDGNNNGRLDPGETVELLIAISNPGDYDAMNAEMMISTASSDVVINSSTWSQAALAAGETSNASFNISVNDDAMIGAGVNILAEATSEYHNASKTYIEKIGLIFEDFETANFDQFDWMFGGNSPWIIDTEEVYEGDYSARSGNIGNSSTSELSLIYDVMFDDSISFMRKVSSEADYDFLEFHIDGELIDQWSGDQDWERVAFAVSQGEHTFKWVYSKDVYVTGGLDKAWIDYIILPPENRTTAYAGADVAICQGDTYQLQGEANKYDLIEWTTSGDGSFSDINILNPVYTPGTNDITNVSVELTMSVSETGGESISDAMILTINALPSAYLMGDTAICYGQPANLSIMLEGMAPWTVYGNDALDTLEIYETPYTWQIEPEATTYYEILAVSDANGCRSEEMSSTTVEVHELPTALIQGEYDVCFGDSAMLSVELSGTAPWELAIDGLGSRTADESPYTFWVNPKDSTSYSILEVSDANLCSNTGEGIAIVNVLDLPLVSIGSDTSICHNHTLTLDAGNPGFDYLWSTGETTQSITIDSTGAGIGGTKVISVEVTNPETSCMSSDIISVYFEDCSGIADYANIEGVKVFPNPNKGQFTLEINNEKVLQANIKIINAYGNIVEDGIPVSSNGYFSRDFDLSHLQAGIYYLYVEAKDARSIQKIVIRK